MSDSSASVESSRRRPPVTAHNQSRIKSYVRCRRQFYYRYDYPVLVMGADPGKELRPIYPSLPLKRGSWMHKLQEAYFLSMANMPTVVKVQRGKKIREVEVEGWEGVHEVLTGEFNRLFEEEREQYGDLPTDCERMFRGYLRRWAGDVDRFRLARLHDGGPAIEFLLQWSLAKFGVKAPFKGRVDLMVEDLEYGGLWIRDAKWVKSIPGPNERIMSPQNIMYAWAGRKMGYDLRGFIYDYGRTKPPTEPRILRNGTVSLAKSIDSDRYTYLKQIKKAHGRHWKEWLPIYKYKLQELKEREVTWFDRERIPVEGPRMNNGLREFTQAAQEVEQRGMPFRTYIRSCQWDCEFLEPCTAQFQGLDIKRLMATQYNIEDERYGFDEESAAA